MPVLYGHLRRFGMVIGLFRRFGMDICGGLVWIFAQVWYGYWCRLSMDICAGWYGYLRRFGMDIGAG